jgi:putative thiamine transport system substrate-binding protein
MLCSCGLWFSEAVTRLMILCPMGLSMTTPDPITRRRCFQGLLAGWVSASVDAREGGGPAAQPSQVFGTEWQSMLQRARGQTVAFNAWGGSEQVNAYLRWADGELLRLYGVRLRHVKVADIAETVKRLRAEKAAGRVNGGSVDMVWINGENFLNLKREGLLSGPFVEQLPNYRGVDTVGKPTTLMDFSEPVEGMEAPWGMAQLTFFADRVRLPEPPDGAAALLEWARRHPGRFTYPRPPEFHGTTFLKQVLLELNADRALLDRSVDTAAFQRVTAPLWAWLDALHPHLWRQGRQHPASAAVIRQMVADGELWIGLTFNPNEAAAEIHAGRLPATVRSWQPSAGSIGNTHFLAIPFNAAASDGARVAIDFLLSPPAQARKADVRVWGDDTVLAVQRLPSAQRALFEAAALPGRVEQPAPVRLEPHGSWVEPLERAWVQRFGRG